MKHANQVLRARNFVLGLLVLIAVLILMPSSSEPQISSSYAEFQAMSLEQLKSLQVKLTFVGEQARPIPSVAFTSIFHTLDLGKFVPFRRSGINYSNDELAVRSFSASPEELKALIDGVGTLPDVTAGGVAEEVFLSFALFNSAGPGHPSHDAHGLHAGDRAFEAVLNQSDAAAVLGKVLRALQSNSLGSRVLSAMACSLDVLGPDRPIDVSGKVTVAVSGVRLSRTTGRFVATATVKNNSPDTIPGPVSLVLDLEGNVSLFNADGQTCATSPEGREFINFALTGNALPPGESAEVVLEFNNPDREGIKPTTKALAGPGAR